VAELPTRNSGPTCETKTNNAKHGERNLRHHRNDNKLHQPRRNRVSRSRQSGCAHGKEPRRSQRTQPKRQASNNWPRVVPLRRRCKQALDATAISEIPFLFSRFPDSTSGWQTRQLQNQAWDRKSFRAESRMERLGKPRRGREGRRLSEREVSESNPVVVAQGNATGSFDFAALRSG